MPSVDFISIQETVLRLISSIILSGFIGVEREMHGRPAGLRTHVLVCLGTTTVIIGSLYLFEYFHSSAWYSYVSLAPGRIEAGIVTGIGFIGAGCIIRVGDYVRGLTTAACLWFVAALGIIIGHGMLLTAIISTALALVILVFFNKIETYLPALQYYNLRIVFLLENAGAIRDKCMELFSSHRIDTMHVVWSYDKSESSGTIVYSLRMRRLEYLNEVIDPLISDPAIIQVSLE